jgi:hypothetical protein
VSHQLSVLTCISFMVRMLNIFSCLSWLWCILYAFWKLNNRAY